MFHPTYDIETGTKNYSTIRNVFAKEFRPKVSGAHTRLSGAVTSWHFRFDAGHLVVGYNSGEVWEYDLHDYSKS